MIIVKLMGGMGNQMFQYALAKSLSVKYDIPFCMDRNYIDNFDWRNYDLDLFQIDQNFAQNHIEADTVGEGWGNFGFQERIYNIFDNIPKDRDIYLDGYFQHIGYIEQIYGLLTEQFSLKKKIEDSRTLLLLDDIEKSNSVMLNVRRTDFVNNSYHGTMDVGYYSKAISIISERTEGARYFIFSDDIEWCRQNLGFIENSVIVDHSHKGDRFGDYLELMKSCKHFIIPNSSFAWWSAYLSQSDGKIVIAPNNWILDSSNQSCDIVSEKLNWIKI